MIRSETRPSSSACDRSDQHRDPDGGHEVLLVDGGHVGRGEGADPHERLVAERDLAGVAQQHVERQPDDGVDDGLGEDVDLDPAAGEGEHQHQRRPGRPRPCHRAEPDRSGR